MKKRLVAIVAVVLVAAGAFAYLRYWRRPAPPRVVTAAVERGDVVQAVGATGTLEAVTTVQVGTQVSGTIAELHADFNSVVRKGQVVARLDPSLFQTQIEQARANLLRSQAEVERLRVTVEDARTKLRRAEELAGRGLISTQELEAAQLNVKTADAQLQSAAAAVTQARATLNQNQVNLQHTVIEAPIDGIVISRNVDVGQTVAASMQAPTLFVIAADLTKMRVNANIDEADVGQIRPGQRVAFRVDAFPEQEFVGRVSQVRLQPQTVQNVVTYNTVIDVPNPDFRLKPGMTANVGIEIARRENVLRIPATALRFRPTADTFAAVGQPVPPELQRGPGARQAAADTTGAAGGPGRSAPAADGRPAQADDVRQAAATRRPDEPVPAREDAAAANQPASAERASGRRVANRRSRDGRAPNGPQRSGDAASSPRGSAQRTASGANTAPRWQQADTFDALFAPLPVRETPGRAWRYVDGRLESVRLRLGIGDGSFTEVVAGDVAEGQQVVTSVTTGAASGATAGSAGGGASRSPLMGPTRRSGGPPGVRNAAPGGR